MMENDSGLTTLLKSTRFRRTRKLWIPTAALLLAAFILLVLQIRESRFISGPPQTRAICFCCKEGSLPRVIPEVCHLELQVTSWLTNQPSLCAQPPPQFSFSPSLITRSPKRKAIVTSLFVAQADVNTHRLSDSGWFFTGAYFHAWTFMKREETRIRDEEDVEFVVMITEMVPKGYRIALEDLGVRLLVVPIIEIEGRKKIDGDKYQYLYTKLNLFRLEGIYDSILFFDVDLFFLRTSPLALFSYIPQNATYFSDQRTNGNADTFAGYGDQALHNRYWHAEKSEYPWTVLPQRYNTHHLEERNVTEIENGIGFHAKFWSECHLFSEASAPLFLEFQKTADELRGWQMQRLERGEVDVGVILMPSVSPDCQTWMHFVKNKAAMFMRVGMLSVQGTDKGVLESRRTNHQIFLLEQLRKVTELFSRFDIVWILNDTVEMSTPVNRTIQHDLSEKLNKFLTEHDSKLGEMKDTEVWELLLKEYTKFGGKPALMVRGKSPFYTFPTDACEGFQQSEIYGERA
ncbi:hypothetical protein BCR33DRAFT_720367 [Rhizoclosmatium globosum]|uniref:Nucleotide-diphospho-sugar transferase domain-containing protein n=1 Tax=Rhizoclosmatium globosum TaxID=329046 RepID=A0A1Y2BWU9_9FUNG|nr:hypothetical protein BCR33DRAFT_720367 [Rhizoclosmatium globosum]|eukprot:ORY39127.1 hypothetical protein BCR33DRAFT_720367 [Rhizoclosmatium globosum]